MKVLIILWTIVAGVFVLVMFGLTAYQLTRTYDFGVALLFFVIGVSSLLSVCLASLWLIFWLPEDSEPESPELPTDDKGLTADDYVGQWLLDALEKENSCSRTSMFDDWN